MQSGKPAEKLLQRLLQSDKIRNQYVLLLENENGSTRISVQICETVTHFSEPFGNGIYTSSPQNFFPS